MVHGIYRPWMRQTTTYIVNNWQNDCRGHGCGGGMDKSALWMFGIGAGLQFLGSAFGGQETMYGQKEGWFTRLFTLNKKQPEQEVENNTQTPEKTIENLNKFYNQYTWIHEGGKFYGKPNDGGETIEVNSFEDVVRIMSENAPTKPVAKKEIAEKQIQKEITEFNQTISEKNIQLVSNQEGKYEFTKIDPKGADSKINGTFETIQAARTAYDEAYKEETTPPGGGTTPTGGGGAAKGGGTTPPAGGGTTVAKNWGNSGDHGNWSVYESGHWASGDAQFKDKSGNVYELRCKDKTHLNFSEKKVHLNKDNTAIQVGKLHRVKVHEFFDKETKQTIPARCDNEGYIWVTVGDKEIRVEEFLSNPDKYRKQS